MTEDFFTKANGKINLSIFPNGFIWDNGVVYAKFSLLIGLNHHSVTDVPVDKPNDLIKYIGKILDDRRDKLLMYFQGTATPANIKFERTNFFDSDSLLHWQSLFAFNKFVIHGKESEPKAFGKSADSESDFIEQRIANSRYLHDYTMTPAPSAGSELAKSEVVEMPWLQALSDPTGTYAASLNQRLADQNARYASIHEQGRQNALRFTAAKASLATKENGYDLLSVINSIYQHPRMAHAFGLLQDIYIDESFLMTASYFSNNPKTERFVFLTCPADSASYFESTTKKNLPAGVLTPILDLINITAWKGKINNAYRYYHGFKNWGLLSWDPAKFDFRTISKDKELENEKYLADRIEQMKDSVEQGSLSGFKQPPLEGIYLLQKANANSQCDDLMAPEENIALLGLNIAVTVGDTLASSAIYSLCRREVLYQPKNRLKKIPHREEGWIHMNLSVDSLEGGQNPGTVFCWTGNNLCITQEKQAHQDQKLTEKEKRLTGAVIGNLTYDAKEQQEYVRKYGYDFSYHFIPGEEIQLVGGKNYVFWIRLVQSNGYTLPLRSENGSIELSLAEIMNSRADVTEYIFPFPGSFDTSQVPVNPPTLLATKKFENTDTKTTESETHLVIHQGQKTAARLVFPPPITLQFAQFLGMLSPEYLRPTDESMYIRQGKQLIKKAINTFPKSSSALREKVDYLPDKRAVRIKIRPADWFTRNFFLKDYSATSNPYELDKYFEYEVAGDQVYNTCKARPLSLQWQGMQHAQMKTTGKDIVFTIGPGLQLKYNIQFVDSQGKESPLLTKLAGLRSLLESVFFISDIDHPEFPKATFALSHVVKKPLKPQLDKNIIVERPTHKDDLAKAFISLSVPNLNTKTVHELRLIAGWYSINDDGVSLPSGTELQRQAVKWKKRPGLADSLLEKEYPASIFDQLQNEVTDKVYKNEFGFLIKFNDDLRKDLKINTTLVTFSIGGATKAELVYTEANMATFTLTCSGITLKIDNINTASNDAHIFLFKYFIGASNLNGDTRLGLEVNYNNIRKVPMIGISDLPFTDLSEKNLTLHPTLEARLLTIVDPAAAFLFIHNNAYFAYTLETTAGYLEKTLRVQAVSRFAEFFPSSAPKDTLSDSMNITNVVFPNNVKPKIPTFQLTPLIWREQTADTIKRSMQVMFEIDRPLKNGEKIALIVKENEVLSDRTSAIGRDMTSFGEDFTDADLSNYLQDIKKLPYLSKYYTDEYKINKTGKYSFLIVEPFFDQRKNKWVAVLSLDPDKLRTLRGEHAESLAAYNPFLKIVLATYVPKSSTNNCLSELTLPKYVNLLTQRIVTFKKTGTKLMLRIENIDQVKKDNTAQKKTIFLAGLREKSGSRITGTPMVSDSDVQKQAYLHLLDDRGMVTIYGIGNRVICLYEYELFHNTNFDPNNLPVNFMEHPGLRLVYAEELIIG